MLIVMLKLIHTEKGSDSFISYANIKLIEDWKGFRQFYRVMHNFTQNKTSEC